MCQKVTSVPGYQLMTVHLKLINEPNIPIEADIITPNHFANKSIEDIRKLVIHQGNKTCKIEDFFEVSGESAKNPSEVKIELTGDLKRVKYIGYKMNGGRIEIYGNVGMYVGSQMQAGRIHVYGSVDSWAASEMAGGNIQIEGNAGDFLCAGLRGSTKGMRGGRVYVAGNVGREMAAHMRRGFIAIKGNVDELAAARMLGGTIIVCGDAGPRMGVQATRGMIMIMGKIESVFPSYRYNDTARREFICYYLRYLKEKRSDFIEEINSEDKWIKFQGDFSEGEPFAEIYAIEKMNAHLLQGARKR